MLAIRSEVSKLMIVCCWSMFCTICRHWQQAIPTIWTAAYKFWWDISVIWFISAIYAFEIWQCILRRIVLWHEKSLQWCFKSESRSRLNIPTKHFLLSLATLLVSLFEMQVRCLSYTTETQTSRWRIER